MPTSSSVPVNPVSRRLPRGPVWSQPGAFTACAVAFVLAAVIAAVVRVATPIAHGWWLVAYLSLVGGVAQLLLGPGLAALGRGVAAPTPGERDTLAQLVLWNSGAVIVAVSDLAGSAVGVLIGSVGLMAALVLFARALRALRNGAPRPLPVRGQRAYLALLAFMAVSTVLGCGLAGAL